MLRKTKRVDMLNGPIVSGIVAFALPMVFSSILQIFFNVADTVVVGKFAGSSALAAVGGTGSIIFLITALFGGLGTGCNVVVARMIGEGSYEKIGKAVHTAIFTALVGGLIFTFVGYYSSSFLLNLVSTPSSYFDLALQYMHIYFLGLIFIALYNFGSAILRANGDSKRPLYYLAVSGIVNVVLNLYMVIVLDLAVAGVAWATVISQAISAGLVILSLRHQEDATRLYLKRLSFDLESFLEIIKIGVPAGLQGMIFSLSNVAILSALNSFDSMQIVAANSAAANLESFVYIGITGFSSAAITFTSQNMGAGNYKRVAPILLSSFILSFIVSFALGIFMYIYSDSLLSFYSNDLEVISLGKIRMYYVARLLFLNGLMDIVISSLRGMGYSTRPTILMLIGICGLRLYWVWFVFPLNKTLANLYLCYPLSWIVSLVVEILFWFYVYFRFLKPRMA